MSAPVIATPVFLIPENAPFTAEQRAWLSGLFAATLAPQGLGATALGGGEATEARADDHDARARRARLDLVVHGLNSERWGASFVASIASSHGAAARLQRNATIGFIRVTTGPERSNSYSKAIAPFLRWKAATAWAGGAAL